MHFSLLWRYSQRRRQSAEVRSTSSGRQAVSCLPELPAGSQNSGSYLFSSTYVHQAPVAQSLCEADMQQALLERLQCRHGKTSRAHIHMRAGDAQLYYILLMP